MAVQSVFLSLPFGNSSPFHLGTPFPFHVVLVRIIIMFVHNLPISYLPFLFRGRNVLIRDPHLPGYSVQGKAHDLIRQMRILLRTFVITASGSDICVVRMKVQDK